ncbi:MAG: alpha-2-macroglobulin family protein, partial [Chitinophagaceae bacterium]|nr:alpha-2-macroglobulin family protein [Chitinophagaceae bacterium]
LLSSKRYGYYPKDSRSSGDEDNYYADDNESDNLTMGDVIYEKEIDTRSLPQVGNSRLFQFNIEDRLPDFKGIYHIKVRSSKDYWVSDSRFISVSDLGLIAKEGRDKLTVFANSIQTAGPLEGVNIIAYGNNNQVLGIGATNTDGVAEIAYTRKEFAGFRPAMVIAKTESDFNYLPFNTTKVNTSRFETGGKQSNSTGLDAFVYAERDIYRPGEKVNFSVIVRNRDWQTPGELPLKLKFLLPNGKELKTFRKTLNEQGSVEGNVDISTAAITGSYTLEVYTSNDVLLGNKNFSIEEFVPDRIKVTAKLDQPSLQPGTTAKLSVNAINFFGPPASNRNYEAEIQIKSKYFSPKKYERYDFSIENQGLSLDKVVREGKTDELGNAAELYEVPAMFRNSGLLQANFYATVFDETGRPVSRSVSADIFTQPVFFGVAEDGFSYYPLNQQVKFPVVALDKDEHVLSGAKAVVKMIRHEYKTVLSKSGNYFRYESQEEDKLLSEQTITVSGGNTFYAFVPRSPGNYELRISLPDAAGYVSKKFYSYGSWGGDNNSFDVSTEGNVDIETDRAAYKTGETAKVLFKAPFDGKMLVTVENDKVISHQYVNVEKRSASIDLKIAAEHLPNIFITATLIKPHGVSDIPLTVAHGFQNVKVEERTRLNRVEIVAAKTTRSATTQQVTVKAAPGSFVTLAAVDNGVLQVTDFKTPDPYDYFYSPRALEVDAYDLYPYLFPEVRARLSSTGGDAESDMQKRINPMPAKRVQIVSYWSGIAKAGGDGNARFAFNVPHFSGQIRLMAVAYKDNTFGSAEFATTVADPIVLSTALPRFLSPGDTISVPVTITNTTSKKGEAVASVRSSGPLKVLGAAQQSVSVNANSETRAVFNIVAASAADTGRVYVEVQGFGEKFSDETAIGVRPASPLQLITGSGAMSGRTDLAIPVSDFMPGSMKYKLVLSRSPLLESGKQLKYLIQYPYGCTEQVISSAFPQLYYSDLAAQLAVQQENNSSANENVLEAIRKIKLRQLYNGAVTLWDGEGTENWWSTIYAAHFLIEAQKAGFDVDNSLLGNLLNYINGKLRNKQTIIYYYNRDQKKKIAPKEVAYSLYVLSLASRANISAMNYYKANPDLLSLDSKYLLSVSYAVSGDKKRFREMLPTSFSGEVSVPQTGGSFYSPIRDEAIALNALIEVDPGNAQIPLMAQHVADQLKERSWYNTQESAFGLLALGKVAKAAGNSDVTAEIKVKGKNVAAFNGKDMTLSAKQLGGNAVEINAKGNGKLYYYWQSEGISVSGQYRQEDNYIKVRRQFYDRYGKKIANNVFKQNDLVIVQLSLEKSYSAAVENIVLTDILPAGFEIENPRTKEISGMDWVKDASTPSSLDVRDDRINLFVDLYSNRQVYYYAVRAVSPGSYVLGPVAADAMYNGEYHSYNGAGKVRVANN